MTHNPYEPAPKILAVFNFFDQERQFAFTNGPYQGAYQEYFNGAEVVFDAETRLEQPPWGWRVYVGR